MDITQSHDIGVDSKPHSESITKDSNTGELSEVLKQLEGQKEVTTEDGYSGKLLLDHTSVTVQAKGYKTSTRNLSASRMYPNLSDADLSLVSIALVYLVSNSFDTGISSACAISSRAITLGVAFAVSICWIWFLL